MTISIHVNRSITVQATARVAGEHRQVGGSGSCCRAKAKFRDYFAGLGEAPTSLRGAAFARKLRAEYNALGLLTKQVAPK